MINNEAINYSREKKKNQLAILSLIEGEKENGQKRDTRLPTVKEFFTTTSCTPLSTTNVHRPTYHPLLLPAKMITMAPVLL